MPRTGDRVMATQAGLFFGLLGPLAVWRDGRPLELGTPQEQRVLAALLLHRKELVTTDELVDALWGEAPPPNAVQVVRTYVSRLRRRLVEPGEETVPLAGRMGGYVLATREGQADVDHFESHARTGRTRLQAGDFPAAVSHLGMALALVRGPPLGGMAYESFCRAEVERLEELGLLVREDLVEARLGRGEHRTLIPELRAAVAEQPLRERFRRQLMLALYRSGRQAEALEAYRQARELLRERLGLEPGPELRVLERRILLQEQTLDHGAVGRAHGLPRYPTSFVGRRADLQAVQARVRRERLVTLVGPAGTGKTRLAASVVGRLRDAFPDGIWWVDLAPADADGVAFAVASSLGLQDVPGRAAEDLVVARLRGASVLLVIDNCEHVAAPAAALAHRVLGETETARILATSREPLQVAGEGVHEVPPLPVSAGAGASADELAESDAARLFVARATTLLGRFTLDEPNVAAVARVVDRLDGLPLAIELAAGKLRSLSPTELAERLEQSPALLGGDARGTAARHRTLEAAIAWSFDLLTDAEHAALLRLAIFPGTFDGRAAEAVATDGKVEPSSALLLLTRLVERSLVAVEIGEPSRYRLLWTVRTFALERARAASELEAAAERHRDHYVELGEQVWRHMIGPGLAAWLPRARAEQDNFRAALRWSLEQGHGDAALQLASALVGWWFRSGQLNEGLALLERALALAEESSPWRPRALMGRALLGPAVGVPDAAEATAAAVAACEGAESELLAFALVFRAQTQIGEDRLDEAEAAIERARPIFAALAHPERHACGQWLGVVRLRRGDLDGAREALVRAVEGYRRVRKPLDAGWSLVELAQVELAAGRVDEAERWATDAVRDFRQRGDPRGLAAAFTRLGRVHAARHDETRARLFLDEALELARRWEYQLEGDEAETALRQFDSGVAGPSRV